MNESVLLEKAISLIQSVKGKSLSFSERKEQAIALSALIIEEARRIQTEKEKKQQSELAGMMNDPIGKVFITTMTDQCFRSQQNYRIADQLTYVMETIGIPHYLPLNKRISLEAFKVIGKPLSFVSVPLTMKMIRKETQNVILPGEEKELLEHIRTRFKEGVRINLNHLGEAILGEEEALRRLQVYLDDLTKPEIEYISIKISTIFSQINLLAWDDTLQVLSERLRLLYRTAKTHLFTKPNGAKVPKFVNLDMEEYKDLHLSVALFCKVLDEKEFHQYEAGIVLQSYLPDSFLIQEKLTQWALERVAKGKAPIKIRLVKGANLAMEQVESALHEWPQPPYTTKLEVDANYKKMMIYGCQKKHAQVAHLGIASHNVFDISYALLLRAENEVENEVCFEMLEGMADHIRRVVQKLSGDMLLYCPAAKEEEFQNAVAYLVRRLDENTAPENFLRHAFDLVPGSPEWNQQTQFFAKACEESMIVSNLPRRIQDRNKKEKSSSCVKRFYNEPDTDWSLPLNREWAEQIKTKWQSAKIEDIPLVIDGKPIFNSENGSGFDPAYPNKVLYHYALASMDQANEALSCAVSAAKDWSQSSIVDRMDILSRIAQELRDHRGDLLGIMMADTGKTIFEGDGEVSEAIDFAEYYRLNLEEWHQFPDIEWQSNGVVLVTPPWNFPCSIPAGGILAALATGNAVIFKPAPESVLVGWHLVQLFWKAGVSQSVLQFINCEDEPVGSFLVKDPRISTVILTGSTETAKLFLKMRPGIHLLAETGGKNVIVVSDMADRDMAIRDILQSAFGHAGQKCSACSLAILQKEVYDDAHFLQQLRDAAQSFSVGSQWDFKTKVNPLIRVPHPALLRGLTELEAEESWLLEPKQDATNPQLWSPGIKLGVTPRSFTFQHELFGPVLGLVRADNFEHALEMMNLTPYGLTAGIQSLDERELELWKSQVEAGNCYINRTITGAIVERQPFGGCKESSFGKGAKAGGPNYLVQLMDPKQISLPSNCATPSSAVCQFSTSAEKEFSNEMDLPLWKASIGSYAYFFNEYFSKAHDPCAVLGQDNLQVYVPHANIVFRVQKNESAMDILRIIAAAITCESPLEISVEDEHLFSKLQSLSLPAWIQCKNESDKNFVTRLQEEKKRRVRFLQKPSTFILQELAQQACHLHISPVLANGRIELLHFLREVSISNNYHRYGNLGNRENEIRSPIPGSPKKDKISECKGCDCYG